MPIFWLKYVTGVDLSKHCIYCLLGSKSKKVDKSLLRGPKELHVELNEARAPFLYLCGVAYPYVWDTNFHLAFRPKEGAIAKVENGIHSVVIANAEQVTFCEADCDPNDRNFKNPMFRTCRNWQFANRYQSEIEKWNRGE